MRYTVAIVDDEPHARRYIKDLLRKDTEIEIIGECKNGRQALSLIKNKRPDIVLLDIQMPGISGIEVAQELKAYDAVVIFTTAFDHYALKAFEVEALNYLLKPFDEKRFFEILEQAKKMIVLEQKANLGEKLINFYTDFKQSQSPGITKFTIKENGIDRDIDTTDILFIEARSVYVILNLSNDALLYRTTINILEQELPSNFLRIHRSYIINTNYIQNFKYLNNNTFRFTMENNAEIVSSRSYKNTINEYLSM